LNQPLLLATTASLARVTANKVDSNLMMAALLLLAVQTQGIGVSWWMGSRV
jgi:hypothetical protein